jgi:hypothetical protein
MISQIRGLTRLFRLRQVYLSTGRLFVTSTLPQEDQHVNERCGIFAGVPYHPATPATGPNREMELWTLGHSADVRSGRTIGALERVGGSWDRVS